MSKRNGKRRTRVNGTHKNGTGKGTQRYDWYFNRSASRFMPDGRLAFGRVNNATLSEAKKRVKKVLHLDSTRDLPSDFYLQRREGSHWVTVFTGNATPRRAPSTAA